MALAWSFAGCAADEAPATGSLAVNLTASAPSGAVYRLRDATITVTDNIAPLVFHTEEDPSRATLSADVAVGDYTASLAAGWRLERVQGATATTVEAALISANPVTFRVNESARTPVSFKFRTAAGEVDFAQGYDIALDVSETTPHGIAIARVTPYGAASGVGVFARGAHDDATPLRMIAGSSITMVTPGDMLAVGEQLFVIDSSTHAIDIYPRLASNTAPVRRIAGPATTLASPRSIAAFNGELFVAQSYGPILVFPLDGTGDIAPRRSLNVPYDVLRIAVSQGEIYACVSQSNRIIVYAATASGDATPTREIVGATTELSYPYAIAVQGGELFVSQFYTARIGVFAASASGDVAPLRTIGDSSTQYGNGQLVIFDNELFVSRGIEIAVYPVAGASTSPSRVIKGSSNLAFNATGVAVF